MKSLITQALNLANVGILIIDEDKNIIMWNNWMERFTNQLSEDIVGQSLFDLAPQFNKPLYKNVLAKVFSSGQSRFFSSSLHKAFFLPEEVNDITKVRQNVNIQPLVEDGKTFALIQVDDMTTTFNRVSKLKSLIKELEVEVQEVKTSEQINKHLAMHDNLTGIPNRVYFYDRLEWALNYAQRNQNKLAIMYLDLDGFKAINDTYGHCAGDQILREVTCRLKSCIRTIDTLARIGGDEFAAILIQLKDIEGAAVVAQKFIDIIEKPFNINGQEINLTISIGISIHPDNAVKAKELVKLADQAMYKIKRSGKNSYAYVENT